MIVNILGGLSLPVSASRYRGEMLNDLLLVHLLIWIY